MIPGLRGLLRSPICLGIAFLIGPGARRLAGETTPLTAAERRQMTASERVEAVNAARHTLIQAATGLVVIGGVAFTALGLWYTARTVETTREGQITDRYTKAVEQLGSNKLDVRLGGIYALQRLASDSPRDKDTIRNVLAAFVRGHDACTPSPGREKLPKQCTTANLKTFSDVPLAKLGADMFAALTIAPTLATSKVDGSVSHLADFSRARFPLVDLYGANLSSANLYDANLRGANLYDAYLRGAYLVDAYLRGANLGVADLSVANLISADLGGADLGGANLYGVNLGGANLGGANLYGVNLGGANLSGANLRGADLRAVTGMTTAEIKAVAKTDTKTKF